MYLLLQLVQDFFHSTITNLGGQIECACEEIRYYMSIIDKYRQVF